MQVFPQRTNKIVKFGLLRPCTILVKCSGNGEISVTRLIDPVEKIKKLGELLEGHYITQEEYA